MLFTDYDPNKSWKTMSLLDASFFVFARTIKPDQSRPDQTRQSKYNYNPPLIFQIRQTVKWAKSIENELLFVILSCLPSPASLNLWYGHSIPFDYIWTLNIRSKILILYFHKNQINQNYFVWKCANLRKLQLEMVELVFLWAILVVGWMLHCWNQHWTC